MELSAVLFEKLGVVLSNHPGVASSVKRLDPTQDFELRLPNNDPGAFSGSITMRGSDGPLATMSLRFKAATSGSARHIGPLRVETTPANNGPDAGSAVKVMALSLAMTEFWYQHACPR